MRWTGDEGTYSCLVTAQHWRREADALGDAQLYTAGGRYEVRVRRTPQGWRIDRPPLPDDLALGRSTHPGASVTDVVVVGSGPAGLTAALSAQEAGARVLVLEAEQVVGGAGRLAGGLILAAGTEVQRRFGLEDSADDFYQEYLLINQYEPEPGLVARIVYDGAATISWLEELGVSFREVMRGGAERVPRAHVGDSGSPEGGGRYLIDVLTQRCRERGIEIAVGRRVDRLLREGNAVTGVGIGGDELAAAAVVLATGGFGANRELIAQHLPTLAAAGDWVFYQGPASSRGDALALVEPLGAHIAGADRAAAALSLKTSGGPVERAYDPYLPAWALVVGPDGRRMFSETTVPYGGTQRPRHRGRRSRVRPVRRPNAGR